mgnify:CR=1 FL=1
MSDPKRCVMCQAVLVVRIVPRPGEGYSDRVLLCPECDGTVLGAAAAISRRAPR